jgi:AhpD family alkylhydroperoxidase
MANALEQVPWESCVLERGRDRALESYARRRWGFPNPSVPYFVPVPWVVRAIVDLHPEYGLLMHLDQSVADLVALAVSQENSCRFCYAAVRALLWSQGLGRARIERIEQDLTRADLSPRTLAAIAFGRSQSRRGPAEARAAREALLGAGVSAAELKEIAFVVANTDFSNRLHTVPAIPVRRIERLPERLHTRLLRPVLGRVFTWRRHRGRPTPLARQPSYPLARLVTSYGDSPIAPALGRILEEMWASPVLGRRCKLLMFAVVARGLSCDVCPPDVHEALRQEGIKEDTLAHVLTHLDAPELDPVERVLVPFARETIWYEPAALQRRARALRDRLTTPQLVEAIGVASLANGLCRLGPFVLDPA